MPEASRPPLASAEIPLLPYARQSIDESDRDAVLSVLRSEYLTTGPAVRAFETALGEFTGSGHAVALSSGTAALHAAYAAIDLGPGDEVVMPPLTFAATANAALYVGARPVFADIELDTGTVDPSAVEASLTTRTRAIVAVDFAGHPADYDRLRAIADRHSLALIADAAHSLGARYRGRPVGSLADLTALSFHPVKLITTGEGGAVLTDDPAMADRLASFRTHGVVRDPSRLVAPEGPWHYEMHRLGYNYRLTDLQAALGVSQLAKATQFLERRRSIAQTYLTSLAPLPDVILPTIRADVEHAWHLFVVRAAGGSRARRRLFSHLRRARIAAQVHYRPVYLHPYYSDLGYAAGTCPRAEAFYAGAVSVPLFPAMGDDDVARVISALQATRQTLADNGSEADV